MKNRIDSRKTVETGVNPLLCAFNFFVANYLSPHALPPVEVARFNSLVPYFTRKGYIIADQLRKHGRPRVSQSGNRGRRWRGKYCFTSRDEQIIGYQTNNIFEYPWNLV